MKKSFGIDSPRRNRPAFRLDTKLWYILKKKWGSMLVKYAEAFVIPEKRTRILDSIFFCFFVDSKSALWKKMLRYASGQIICRISSIFCQRSLLFSSDSV